MNRTQCRYSAKSTPTRNGADVEGDRGYLGVQLSVFVRTELGCVPADAAGLTRVDAHGLSRSVAARGCHAVVYFGMSRGSALGLDSLDAARRRLVDAPCPAPEGSLGSKPTADGLRLRSRMCPRLLVHSVPDTAPGRDSRQKTGAERSAGARRHRCWHAGWILARDLARSPSSPAPGRRSRPLRRL